MFRFLPVALVLAFLVALAAGYAFSSTPPPALAAPPAQGPGVGQPTPAPLEPSEIPLEAFPTEAPASRPGTNLADAGSVDLTRTGSVAAQGPTGSVLVASLNVRAGPSTDYPVIGAAKQAETFKILGQTASCSWLKVRLTSDVEGWMSGDPQYVTFSQACAFIPVAQTPPPAPTRVPGSQPARPPSQPSQPNSPSLPANKGCYLFINQLGAEITLTFTAQGRQWNETWKLPVNAEKVYCLDPGKYTYTLDAPPPWGSTNGWLDVVAGQHYRFPITPAPE